MYTLEALAEELNRQEWAVERMLKNRGYLKQNGEPRKSTIDAGLMNKNGLIKEAGWSVFIEELGYKEVDDEEVVEIDDEENYEEDDEESLSNDDDDDFVDEYENDGDFNNEDFAERFRELLISKGITDKSYIKEIVPALCSEIDYFCSEEDGCANNEEAFELIAEHEILDIVLLYEEGHSARFIAEAINTHNIDGGLDFLYSEVDGDVIEKDLKSVFKKDDFSDYEINFLIEEYFTGFGPALIKEFFGKAYDIFHPAYQNALEHYNDKEKARLFAEACFHSYSEKIPDFNDEFEKFVEDNAPWYKYEPYGDNAEYKPEDYIISTYYEFPNITCYDEQEYTINLGDEFLQAKWFVDAMNEPDNDEPEDSDTNDNVDLVALAEEDNMIGGDVDNDEDEMIDDDDNDGFNIDDWLGEDHDEDDESVADLYDD